MAKIKAVSPLASVISGEAPQERREETVSSDASRAASISGVIPFLVCGYKKIVIQMVMMILVQIANCHGNVDDSMIIL